MFLDEAHITVHGGKGGNGAVAWRREKYVPRGGPEGGDGGNGGSVFFEADPNTDTLSSFAERKVFHAEAGEAGRGKRQAGKNGPDLVLRVPPGTVITDAGTGAILSDLSTTGMQKIIAKGGRGGYGNAHFTTSIRQAPDFAELGEPGFVRSIKLELKLVADIGIIGLPSAGKSTLISVISAAKPKIADYPFTTLVPNLGVVTVKDRTFIACDIPGLIEGASEGKGLGDKFLRHIERCGILLHLLDVSREDLVTDYRVIREELTKYSPVLAEKRELVILNKTDLYGNDVAPLQEELEKQGILVFAAISSATTFGIQDLLKKLLPIVLEERAKRHAEISNATSQIPTIRPQLVTDRADAFVIEENPPGTFTVRGKRIEQIARMTFFENPGALARFRDIAERTGLRKTLERAGAGEGSTVLIGDTDVSGFWR
ncbi:MAG: GTPase ObgE [Patescibacteria group bacterium]